MILESLATRRRFVCLPTGASYLFFSSAELDIFMDRGDCVIVPR
jgi:hypothetical protein